MCLCMYVCMYVCIYLVVYLYAATGGIPDCPLRSWVIRDYKDTVSKGPHESIVIRILIIIQRVSHTGYCHKGLQGFKDIWLRGPNSKKQKHIFLNQKLIEESQNAASCWFPCCAHCLCPHGFLGATRRQKSPNSKITLKSLKSIHIYQNTLKFKLC